jgi:hypothetical protein
VSEEAVMYICTQGVDTEEDSVPQGPSHHLILYLGKVQVSRLVILDDKPCYVLPSIAHVDQSPPEILYISQFIITSQHLDFTPNPHWFATDGLDVAHYVPSCLIIAGPWILVGGVS